MQAGNDASNMMLGFGLLAVVVATAVGLFVLLERRTQAAIAKTTSEWSALADSLGLTLLGEPFHFGLKGKLDGVEVTLRHVQHPDASKKGEPTLDWSCQIVASPGIDTTGLYVVPHGGFAKLVSAVGGADVKTGDASFDEAFVVRADEPWLVPLLLTAKVREMLLEARSRGNGMAIAHGIVRWQGAIAASPEQAKALLLMVTRLAAEVACARAQASSVAVIRRNRA